MRRDLRAVLLALLVVVALVATACDTSTSNDPATVAPTAPTALTSTNATSSTDATSVLSLATQVRLLMAENGMGYLVADISDDLIDAMGISMCALARLDSTAEEFTADVMAASADTSYTADEALAVAATAVLVYCEAEVSRWGY